MVTELNESNFDSFVESNHIAIIDCWAPWCGPCRRMGPIVDEAATELEGKVAFAKLNTDENPQTAAKYGITSIPTMNVYVRGEVAKTIIGAQPKPRLLRELEAFTG